RTSPWRPYSQHQPTSVREGTSATTSLPARPVANALAIHSSISEYGGFIQQVSPVQSSERGSSSDVQNRSTLALSTLAHTSTVNSNSALSASNSSCGVAHSSFSFDRWAVDANASLTIRYHDLK